MSSSCTRCVAKRRRGLRFAMAAALCAAAVGGALGLRGPSAPSDGVASRALRPAAKNALQTRVAHASANVGRTIVSGEQDSAEDGDPRNGTLPRAGTEAAYFASLSREASRDPSGFGQRSLALLRSSGPTCKKIALLRVLFESDSPDLIPVFVFAVRELPRESNGRTDSVPSFVIGFAGEHARQHDGARRVLREVAFEQAPPIAAPLRRRAAAYWAASVSAAEVSDLVDELLHEPDTELVRGALSALSTHLEQDALDRVLPLVETTASRVPRGEPNES